MTAEWCLYFLHASASVCVRDRQTERSLRCPGPHTTLISVLFGDEHGVISKQSLKYPNSAERECFMSTHFSFPPARVIPWPSHYRSFVYANFMLMLCHSKDSGGRKWHPGCRALHVLVFVRVESFHIPSYFSARPMTCCKMRKGLGFR